MKREWKSGDVAMVTLKKADGAAGRPDSVLHIAMRDHCDGWASGTTFDRRIVDAQVADAHPLAVIDPEDREQVERLAITYATTVSARLGDEYLAWENRSVEARERIVGDLLAALREFAAPTPPKPDEPHGLGAVVEAVNDNRFVCVGRAGWVHEQDMSGTPCDWDDIDVVRVLCEGVTP